ESLSVPSLTAQITEWSNKIFVLGTKQNRRMATTVASTVKMHSNGNQCADSNINYNRDNGTWWQQCYTDNGDGCGNDHSNAKHYFDAARPQWAFPVGSLIAKNVGRKTNNELYNASCHNRQRVYVLHKICVGKACKESPKQHNN